MNWKTKQNSKHLFQSTTSIMQIKIRVTSIAAVRIGRHRRAIRQSVRMINTFQPRRFGCLKRWIWVKVRWCRIAKCNTTVCIGWSTRIAKYKESISRWHTDIKNMLEANKTNRLLTSRVWTPLRRIWMATRCSTLRIWLEVWIIVT